MSEIWELLPMRSVVSISRERIDPRSLGDQSLIHYSIPALDETQKPIVQPASAIGSQKFRVSTDAVLVSLLNPRIPRVWLAQGGPDTVCTTEFAVLRPCSDILTLDYLHLWCRSGQFWEQLQRRAVGTTGSRQRAKAEGLADIEMPLPTVPEQRRIVDLVNALDGLAAASESEARCADSLLRAMRSELLVPDDSWREARLGAVATLTIGRTPSRSESSYWTQALDRPFLTIGDMSEWTVGEAREGVTLAAVKAGKAKAVPAGELLMSFKLSIGRVGITDREVYPNEAIVWIAPDDSCRRDFLAHWLSTQDLTGGSVRAVKGSTLNKQTLGQIPVRIPDLTVQAEIEALLEGARSLSDKAHKASERVGELRQIVLSSLLARQIEIQDSYGSSLPEAP